MNEVARNAVARWCDPNSRPLFKRALIDGNGCCCAQGDILRHELRMGDKEIRAIRQEHADHIVAEALGVHISISILLRLVNDSEEGCPQDVLSDLPRFLGKHHEQIQGLFEYFNSHEGHGVFVHQDHSRLVQYAYKASLGPMAPLERKFLQALVASVYVSFSSTSEMLAILEVLFQEQIRNGELGDHPFPFLSNFGFKGPEDIPIASKP